ncbi:unnamed protein product [Effrenium voratum]|nr:unnamed protein product [Effrenium voratum]
MDPFTAPSGSADAYHALCLRHRGLPKGRPDRSGKRLCALSNLGVGSSCFLKDGPTVQPNQAHHHPTCEQVPCSAAIRLSSAFDLSDLGAAGPGTMAEKQIEASAKPSFMTRASTFALSKIKVGTPLYSLAYGVAGGVILSGLVYAGRVAYLTCFDHEYYKIQSRKRYYEKQLLFSREQEESNQAHYLASLSAEYDPVATRMPFQPLDKKYRF